MDLEQRFIEWARKMGYNGNIPKDLNVMVNANTAHIWEQLMAKVEPKQHCLHVRRNILVNRLRSTNERQLSVFNHPVEEIQAWTRKQDLENRLSSVKERIRANNAKLKNLSIETELQGATLKNLQTKIEQHQRYTVLLEAKSEELQRAIVSVNEMISTAKRLTPVEPSVDTNRLEVQESLQKCALKLEKFLENKSKRSKQVQGEFNDNFVSLADTSFPNLTMMNSFEESFNTPIPDSDLNSDIRDVLCKYDQLNIMRCLQDQFEESAIKLTCSGLQLADESLPKANYFSMAELYGRHIKTELEAKHISLEVDRLKRQVYKNIGDVMQNLNKDSRKIFILKINIAELRAAEAFIKHEIDRMQKSTCTSAEGNYILMERSAEKVQQEITDRIDQIRTSFNEIKCHHKRINNVRSDLINNLKKLTVQCSDISWSHPLSIDLCQNEIKVFYKYPINYDRMSDANDSELYMVTSLIDNPYSPPETVIMSLLESKINTRNWRLLLDKSANKPAVRKYRHDELLEREGNINQILEKCIGLHRSLVQKENTVTVDVMKEVISLWMEMPFKHFVSPKRLVDNQNYEYYDKMFSRFLKML